MLSFLDYYFIPWFILAEHMFEVSKYLDSNNADYQETVKNAMDEVFCIKFHNILTGFVNVV